MSVDWLNADYFDLQQTAVLAPEGWQEEADPLATADEAFVKPTGDHRVAVARRGCTILFLGQDSVRVDLATQAQAHAEYARRRAELSGLTLHRLQAAGAALLEARTDESRAMKDLAQLVRTAVAEGMDKVAVAQNAGIARVTLYAMLKDKS